MTIRWTMQQSIGAVASVVVGVAAVVSLAVTRKSAGADITLPSSPLYVLAVTDSVKSLAGEKDEPAPAQPCPDCGQIHARPEAAGANLARSAAMETSNYAYCENCRFYHPVQRPVQVPNFGAPSPPAAP